MKMHLAACARTVTLLLLSAALLVAPGCRTNPVTGRAELSLVSPQQELEMGRQYHPSLVMMYDGEYTGDTELAAYLEAVVKRLHSVSHRREMPVTFSLLNSSVVNAFALPGHVYATRGLLAELDSEAQFAAIMAHELGHVAAGHSAQRMTRRMVTALGFSLGGLALEDVSGAQGVLLAGQVGAILSELSYSRQQETQADRLSAYYMTLAGWNPEAAVEVQEILARLSDREETRLDRYLSTHPPASERIADLRHMIDSRSVPLERIEGDGVFAGRWAARTSGIIEVHRAYKKYDDAALAFGSGQDDRALRLVREAVNMQPDQAPFHRLKGDIHLQSGRTAEARRAYERAIETDPAYAHAEIGLGRTALDEGNYGRAERRFRSVIERFPDSLIAHYGLATSLYRQEKYGEAAPVLSMLSEAAPGNADVAFMLAACYDRTARHTRALEHYRRAVRNNLEEPDRSRAIRRINELSGGQ